MSGVKERREDSTSCSRRSCWPHSGIVAPARIPETDITVRIPVSRVVSSSSSDWAR